MDTGFSNLFLQYFQNISILWKRSNFSSANWISTKIGTNSATKRKHRQTQGSYGSSFIASEVAVLIFVCVKPPKQIQDNDRILRQSKLQLKCWTKCDFVQERTMQFEHTKTLVTNVLTRRKERKPGGGGDIKTRYITPPSLLPRYNLHFVIHPMWCPVPPWYGFFIHQVSIFQQR